jgi:hypothetical protein
MTLRLLIIIKYYLLNLLRIENYLSVKDGVAFITCDTRVLNKYLYLGLILAISYIWYTHFSFDYSFAVIFATIINPKAYLIKRKATIMLILITSTILQFTLTFIVPTYL